MKFLKKMKDYKGYLAEEKKIFSLKIDEKDIIVKYYKYKIKW
jgi:hypothetical protein